MMLVAIVYVFAFLELFHDFLKLVLLIDTGNLLQVHQVHQAAERQPYFPLHDPPAPDSVLSTTGWKVGD
jgi:hypothetical protein